MTILVSYNYVLLHFYVFNPNMAKSTIKMPKLNSSTLLSSERGGFKNYSVLPRCDSFSSCSNDSSVYSGSNSIQTRFRSAKATVNYSVNTRKRSRNSSGSSISSNISCISDKDLKSGIISQASSKTEATNRISNDTKASQLNYPKIKTNNGGIKEENIVNDGHSENSLVLPSRHNLRGKITKKRCACCSSTCATVVLRHYKKYIKTEEKTVISSTKSEGKTVISSTRVKTFVQNSSPVTIQTNESSNVSSNKSKGRKRRSEIEKLYASLHEIEWAKNFSPDNILRQINVRQAASCSAFGRTSTDAYNLPKKTSKKQKLSNNVDELSLKSTKPLESKIDLESAKSRSCNLISSTNKETCTLANCDKDKNVTDLQTTEITSDNCNLCKQSCNSHSSVNITSCSVSHIVNEINIDSVESVHAESLVTENGTDYSDDAHLSYTSDESSSAVSSNIVNLQSKHLLDLKYKNQNKRKSSDTDFSEYSAAPTFFDIAEEGIRTIDACFREVGAEVVVSTCYDQGSSLPLLTSVIENKVSLTDVNKGKVLDDPPILEPCIEFKCKAKDALRENVGKQVEVKSKSAIKTCSKFPVTTVNKTKKYESDYSNSSECDFQNSNGFLGFKKCHTFSKLQYKKARKIVKKYIKQSWSKAQYFHKSKTKPFINSKNVELPTRLNRHFYRLKEGKNLDNDQNSVLSAASSKSDGILYKAADKRTSNMIFHQITDVKYSTNKAENRVIINKNNSFLYDAGKILNYSGEDKKQSVISQIQCSSSQSQSSSLSSLVSTKIETDGRIYKEHISRPTSLFGFSSEYKSIRVNRSVNFTHIILLITRGKSMFLTLETLRELKDAVIRTNNDSSCQVLVINGVGDSFCLGLDLKPLVGPRKKIASTEIAVAVKELVEALSDFKKPLAAVVNGPALGLGMTLLNHADLTIASEKATFCMPYSYLGYMPEGGATLTLPQIVGSTVAMDLLLRGKTLTAREACNVGLITEVLEAKRLPHELVSRVRVLAQNSICALETTKALLKMQLHINLRLVLENEVKLLPRMWLTRTCQDSLRKALESGILSE